MSGNPFPGVFSLVGQVVLVGRREAEPAKASEKMCERESHRVHDVTRLDDASSPVERITRDVGLISCLVNNAGVTRPGRSRRL